MNIDIDLPLITHKEKVYKRSWDIQTATHFDEASYDYYGNVSYRDVKALDSYYDKGADITWHQHIATMELWEKPNLYIVIEDPMEAITLIIEALNGEE